MVRHLLLALAATLVAALWTSPARAVVGQCYADRESPADRSGPASDEGDEWSCRSERPRVKPDQVPICMVEGASGVAPRPRVPVDGARAERADQPQPHQWVPGSREPSAKPQVMLGDGVLATPVPEVPPAVARMLPRVEGARLERRGRKPPVYRPPRG